jgi:hypothetical protein
MDKDTAQKVVRTSIRVMALLNELVGDLQTALPKPAFEEQRRIIGQIMGMVSLDLISPTVALHSCFEIGSAEAWKRAGEFEASHWLQTLHDLELSPDAGGQH